MTKRRQKHLNQQPVNLSRGVRIRKFLGRALGLVLVGVGVWIGWRMVWEGRYRTWNGQESYRLVTRIESQNGAGEWMGMFQYRNFPEKRIDLYLLPGEASVRVVGEYGNYRVGALGRLDELENMHGELVKRTISHVFGMQVNGMIHLSEEALNDDLTWFEEVKRDIFWQTLWMKINLAEGWDLINLLTDVSDAAVSKYDLSKRGIYRRVMDIDGQTILQVNVADLDAVVDDVAMMNVGQYREVAVVLENYTDIPGLADHWSRLVSHEGFDVVGEVNGGDKREKTVLLFSTKDLAESDAGKALRRIFSTGEFSVENTRERRSDVVIQLGRDAAIYGKSEL